jgi:cysteine-rich repeat protein
VASGSIFNEFGFVSAGAGDTDPVCGNGLTESGEECDDSNVDNGDGCSSECKLEPGWSCVGRNPVRCVENAPYCGDDIVNDVDECDDGNYDNDDGCSETCKIEFGWTCVGKYHSVCT